MDCGISLVFLVLILKSGV
nr:Ig VH E4psi [Mus musculus]